MIGDVSDGDQETERTGQRCICGEVRLIMHSTKIDIFESGKRKTSADKNFKKAWSCLKFATVHVGDRENMRKTVLLSVETKM